MNKESNPVTPEWHSDRSWHVILDPPQLAIELDQIDAPAQTAQHFEQDLHPIVRLVVSRF